MNNEDTKVVNTSQAPVTMAKIINDITADYIAKHPVLPDEQTCAEEVTSSVRLAVEMENSIRAKGDKLRSPHDIPLMSIALLIAACPDIALVAVGDKSQMQRKKGLTMEQRYNLPIAIYQHDGWNKGVWEISNNPLNSFGALVEKYKPNATRNDKLEVYTLVKSKLRTVEKCVIPHYVAVNNGIVDVRNKLLLPFSPDIVFTSKIHTNLNMAVANPFITIPEDGSVWDADSWLASLGNPAFVESVKEVIQAACLPLAPRGKMCIFYNRRGNNGKGTICQLIRNLLGEEVTANIPIKEFSTPFGLSKLPGAMAVITDENDTGVSEKALASLRAAITGDRLTINVKFQPIYDFTFHGLILECVNDLNFTSGDAMYAFMRRLHILTFENCFTDAEKRYIKEQLIYREDVLEYILKTVLIDMDYREAFTETAETKAALRLYNIVTNSVVAFLQEILPQCQWDLLPATDFLYEAYKVWYRDINPKGKVIGRNDFLDSVRDYITNDPDASTEWEWTDSTRSQGYIDCSVEEPLLAEYGILALQDPYRSTYASPNKLKSKYSGLKRRTAVFTVVKTDNSDEMEKGA